MLRLSDNPPARFPLDRPLAEDMGLWAVAHVRSRQEKALAHDLVRWQVPYYLPMLETKKRRKDNGKIRKSVVPLFAGYLAFALPEDQWRGLYATRRLVNLLPIEDQGQFVHEIAQVQYALEHGATASIMPTFEVGQPVRVIAGPMMGLEGEVLQHRGRSIFIIRVQMFRQAIRIELDESYLEAVVMA